MRALCTHSLCIDNRFFVGQDKTPNINYNIETTLTAVHLMNPHPPYKGRTWPVNRLAFGTFGRGLYIILYVWLSQLPNGQKLEGILPNRKIKKNTYEKPRCFLPNTQISLPNARLLEHWKDNPKKSNSCFACTKRSFAFWSVWQQKHWVFGLSQIAEAFRLHETLIRFFEAFGTFWKRLATKRMGFWGVLNRFFFC